jgi:D-alanyl-lipoteichoic acid acyltransferase DltB (MBOAT superfamily)
VQFNEIILPLAISFFTFQQIAYLVDVSRGETQETKFLHYCIFVVFFPQLIAGPIVHHKEILPQFLRNPMYRPQVKRLSVGLTILFLGLFKKVIIADEMAMYATPIFYASAQGEVLTFFQAWLGTLAYTFQIYFDYSGYSDIAIGVAWMFGIHLPLNFFSPYKAVNIIEFWRRWNMTLSRFLRDYLYIPLGGNRKGNFRTFINLMITMLLGGLWHGAGWNFIIWGGLHGLYLAINHTWHIIKSSFNYKFYQPDLTRLAARLFTFFTVTISWVFFRAEDFSSAKNILSSMLGLNTISLPRGLAGKLGGLESILTDTGVTFEGMTQGFFHNIGEFYGFLSLCIFIVFFCPNVYQVMGKLQPALASGIPAEELYGHSKITWKPSLAWAFAMAIITTFAILGLNQASEFLYFNF